MRSQNICHWENSCHFTNLGCRYLSHLNDTMEKTYYTDLEEAKDAVRVGKAWGVVYITENFTDAFVARVALGMFKAYAFLILNYSFQIQYYYFGTTFSPLHLAL